MLNPIGGGESHTIFNYFPNGTGPNVNPPATASTIRLPRKIPTCPQFTPACFREAYNPANLQLNQIQDSAHGKAAQLNLEGTVSVAKNYHIGSHTSTFETGFYIRNAHKFDDSYEIDCTPNDVTAIPRYASSSTTSITPHYYDGHIHTARGSAGKRSTPTSRRNPNSVHTPQDRQLPDRTSAEQ